MNPPSKSRPPFVFDGRGINGPDEYRSRLCTLTDAGHALNLGPKLADLLNAEASTPNPANGGNNLIPAVKQLLEDLHDLDNWGDKDLRRMVKESANKVADELAAQPSNGNESGLREALQDIANAGESGPLAGTDMHSVKAYARAALAGSPVSPSGPMFDILRGMEHAASFMQDRATAKGFRGDMADGVAVVAYLSDQEFSMGEYATLFSHNQTLCDGSRLVAKHGDAAQVAQADKLATFIYSE